jgi:UDP-4-amino-4,6-dideoxy-N-acetyl-beta-L-altrosamine transaminase
MRSKIIPYGKHYIDERDINAVIKNLKSGSLTQGPTIEKFENKIKEIVNCRYAVAVSSCTAGMHIALLSSGFKKNNTLLTTPISFVSTANASKFCNGKVKFADISLQDINISTDIIKKIIKKNKINAVIPVHFAGKASDVKLIRKLIGKKTILIEDAAHAFGAKYDDGTMVGSCKYSNATVFSFHPVKTIACGEGGIVTTNDKKVYKNLLRLRSHGINKLDDNFILKNQAYTKKIKNSWYYEMRELGFHYRMTEMQASLGLSQLNKLNKFITRRREIAKKYFNYITSNQKILNFSIAQKVNYNLSSNHLFIIKLNLKKLKKSRAQIMKELLAKNIQTQVHYIPIPMHPFYKKDKSIKLSDFKNAKKYYETCLSIPIFYTLTKKQQIYVLDNLKRIIN